MSENARPRGRPRKDAPTLSAYTAELGTVTVTGVLADRPTVKPTKRVLITAYKVMTRHGRFIAGQFAELPANEADDLIAEGKAE